MDQEIECRIRERAYEIWEEEGRPHGREAQHWQQAAGEMADAQRESRETGKPARKTTTQNASRTKSAEGKTASKKSASGDPTGKKPAKASPEKGAGQTRTGIRKPRTGKTSSS